MTLYVQGPVKIGSNVVYHVENSSYNPGIGTAGITHAGEITPTTLYEVSNTPTGSFSTNHIDTLLGLLINSPIVLSSGAPYEEYAVAVAENSIPTGSGYKIQVPYGLVVPETLTAATNANARLSVTIHPINDGTNPIATIVNSVSCPTTNTHQACFTLGPSTVNNALLDCVAVNDVTVNWNIQVEKLAGCGLNTPTFGHLVGYSPTIVFNLRDMGIFGTFGMQAVPISNVTKFFLRKRQANGALVANATAEHKVVTLASNSGLLMTAAVTGRGAGGIRTGTLTIQPAKGASGILSVTNNVAIT